MRKLIFAIALLVGVIYVLTRLVDVEAIVDTLEHGNWLYIFPAILLQGCWLLVIGVSYRTIYRILGLPETYNRLLRMASASTFLNVVAPVGGVTGIAVFLDSARERHYSTARVMVAGALFVLFDYLGFLFVLVAGLGVLVRRNVLTWPEILGSILLAVGSLGLGSMLFMGMRSGRNLGVILAWASRKINWLLRWIVHRDLLSEERALGFAKDTGDGLRTLSSHPKDVVLLTLMAITGKGMLVGVMLLLFLAFNVPLSVGTVIAGFSVGYLFLIISPTPSGLGVVEGILPLTLSSLYVPLAEATVITVAYRGITFWVPLVVGMISFRTLNQFGKPKKGLN